MDRHKRPRFAAEDRRPFVISPWTGHSVHYNSATLRGRHKRTLGQLPTDITATWTAANHQAQHWSARSATVNSYTVCLTGHAVRSPRLCGHFFSHLLRSGVDGTDQVTFRSFKQTDDGSLAISRAEQSAIGQILLSFTTLIINFGQLFHYQDRSMRTLDAKY